MSFDELVGNLKTYEMNMEDLNKTSECDESNDEEYDETTLMAIGDLDMEEDDVTSEVSILELKEKLHLFSKKKLVSYMSALIDDFQELTSDRNELFNNLESLKFDLIDLEALLGLGSYESFWTNVRSKEGKRMTMKLVDARRRRLSVRAHCWKPCLPIWKFGTRLSDLVYLTLCHSQIETMVTLPYKYDIPRAIWNPPLTRQGIPQPKCAARVAEKILDKKELEFYKWDGDLSHLLQNVRDKLNKVAENWTREEKNHCLEETEKSFKFSGAIL
ncbi:hypothetical protein FXO38_29348 [Capsicum annuum]|nr:hypothetical protein FXO38_29348 [Capsicum annuum]